VRIARRSARPVDLKGASPTVLVVDDDADLIKLIRTYLRLEGLTVREAANRAEMIAAFGQPPPPHLILLDVNPPDASGFDILVRICQHPLAAFITKPFEPDQLARAVRQVLRLKPG